MFLVDKEALEYINSKANSIVIDLKPNPSSGG